MSYKILLPVTNSPELVQDKLRELPLDRLILVNNFDNQEVGLLCNQAEDNGAEVYRYPKNLGLAASWNLGLRRICRDHDDFVIFLSVSAILDGDRSVKTFVDEIRTYEDRYGGQCRYIASHKATLHFFAHTRRSVDIGGEFDENFWPIYFEDTDFSRRSILNGVKKEVVWFNLDHLARSREYSLGVKSDRRLFRLHQMNASRIGEYYTSKWGGVHLSETFIHPFNDPEIGVNDWTVASGVGDWPEGVYEGNFE